MKPACPACGYIHASTDAHAIGRFAGTPSYVAAHAGTPPRATRSEAEADECAWRQGRTQSSPTPGDAGARRVDHRNSRSTSGGQREESASVGEVFPAALMETAARAKAWRDFLAETQMSLMVWQLDASVRAGCEDVRAWLRRCRDELAEVVPS